MLLRAGLVWLLFLLSGCAPMQMQGVNLLQSRNVALDDLQNLANMQQLKKLGANTVAFVPFIRQSTPGSCDLKIDEHYPDERLRRSILNARSAGLRVVLKPQILVEGSWAGEIEPDSEAGWECWFASYHAILLDFAKIAKETGVEVLAVATELVKTELRPEWKSVLAEVRGKYSGQLSYVGQSVGGAVRFSAFDQLDSIAISFYPSLRGVQDRQQMLTKMQEVADGLKLDVKHINKPFWFAEVGITSRVGAMEEPWLWVDAMPEPRIPDTALQAAVLDGWLNTLRGKWHQGILIWNWYSDPQAGGANDVDFTIQNKPAQQNVACHWLGRCN